LPANSAHLNAVQARLALQPHHIARLGKLHQGLQQRLNRFLQQIPLGNNAARYVQVLVRGVGRIPESAIANLFQVFSIGEAITPGGDLGLGPPVSQRILSLFGGSIAVENLEPAGIQFTVTLKNG
jgi:light-regulated signal transduction histidine kinase (bacteriophytochrome)